MTRVGVVTGLAAEARLIGRILDDTSINAPLIACAGPGRGLESAQRVLARGANALISFGLAGGLDPWLKPGDLVCPDRVLSADGEAVATDSLWRERILTEGRISGTDLTVGAVLGSDEPVAGTDAKHRLAHTTGAVAVDMESHSVAALASARDVPFIVVRAVADTADRTVPPAALSAVDADGQIRALAVTLALCASPAQIPAMIALARDTRAGMAALGRAARFGSLVLGLL